MNKRNQKSNKTDTSPLGNQKIATLFSGKDQKWLRTELLSFHDSPHVATLMNWLDKLAKYMAEYITTHQLRNIFKKILDIEREIEQQGSNQLRVKLQLLRPKLAYVAARQNTEEAGNLIQFFNEMLKELGSKDSDQLKRQFGSFKDVFEAVVAFHKYHSIPKAKSK